LNTGINTGKPAVVETGRRQGEMLVDERRGKIVDLVRQRGAMSIKELSRALYVSEMTIRRDLDFLDKTQAIKKHFGGATDRSRPLAEVTSFSLRMELHLREKEAIAAKARELVEENDSLFIDHGTTCALFARELGHFSHITVVTFSLPIIAELANTRVELVSAGGLLHRPNQCFAGPLAEEIVSRFHANKCILGTQGVESHRGLSNGDLLEAQMKSLMADRANEVILLADFTKFTTSGLYPNVPIGKINKIVTDSNADPILLAQYKEMGIEVILAEA
jgi:DeoR/GlpR family transcriptional regulator of sugar metabolism